MNDFVSGMILGGCIVGILFGAIVTWIIRKEDRVMCCHYPGEYQGGKKNGESHIG